MNQKQFLSGLRDELAHLTEEEITEIIADYEAHFAEGRRQGRVEEEIAKSLGHPRSIARHIMANRDVQAAESSRGFRRFLRATLATASTGLRSALLIVGPFLGSAAVLLAFLGAGMVLVLGGLGVMIAILVQYAVIPDLYLMFSPYGAALASFGFACIGGLLVIAGVRLASALYDIAIKHLKITLHTSAVGQATGGSDVPREKSAGARR